MSSIDVYKELKHQYILKKYFGGGDVDMMDVESSFADLQEFYTMLSFITFTLYPDKLYVTSGSKTFQDNINRLKCWQCKVADCGKDANCMVRDTKSRNRNNIHKQLTGETLEKVCECLLVPPIAITI